MMAARVCRVPVRIYHVHGLPYVTATGLRRRILHSSEWVSCACAHRVLCVSPSIREVAVESRLGHPDKLVVLGSGSFGGVDAENMFSPATYPSDTRDRIRSRYGIPPSATVLGFVGRIVADKGVRELVAAWRELRLMHHDLHLLMVGAFELGDPINAEDEALLRDDKHIHLAGQVDHVPEFLLAMDIYVMPSHREGFGMSNIEAAAMRLPVVSTRIPGCVDSVQDGLTGSLVPARDASALVDAIQRYVMDVDLRAQHGEAGRQRVLTDFRPEIKWAELEAEYRRLLADAEVHRRWRPANGRKPVWDTRDRQYGLRVNAPVSTTRDDGTCRMGDGVTNDKAAMLPSDYWSGKYHDTLASPDQDTPFKIDAFLRLWRRAATARPIRLSSYADVGCGSGGMMRGIAAGLCDDGHPLATPVGYEISPHGATLTGPDARFVHGDFLEIGERAELVTLFDVIEHVPAPAVFLAAVAEKCDLIGLHIPLDKTLANEIGDRFRTRLRYPGHLSYWSTAEALTLLTAAGLVVLDYDYTLGFRAPSGRERRIQRIAYPARLLLSCSTPWLLSRAIGGASLMVLAATPSGQRRLSEVR